MTANYEMQKGETITEYYSRRIAEELALGNDAMVVWLKDRRTRAASMDETIQIQKNFFNILDEKKISAVETTEILNPKSEDPETDPSRLQNTGSAERTQPPVDFDPGPLFISTEDTAMGDLRGVLDEAAHLVTGDRQKAYGAPEENFVRIASLWSTHLGDILKRHISPSEVAEMMMLLKLSRCRRTQKRDAYVDIAGYSTLANYLVDEGFGKDMVTERGE